MSHIKNDLLPSCGELVSYIYFADNFINVSYYLPYINSLKNEVLMNEIKLGMKQIISTSVLSKPQLWYFST